MTTKEFIDLWFANESKGALEIPMTPISEVAGILESHGYEQHEENGDETNGWQVDFWYYFQNGDDQICLSGSLFYGDFKLTKE